MTGFNNLFKDAAPAERIRFYAATRQFDHVTEAFTNSFAKNTKAKAEELEVAARVALSVAIRVKNDLAEAEKIAREVQDHPSAPRVLKTDAAVWTKELALWRKDAHEDPTDPRAALAAARELVIRGQLLGEPGSARGDIAYLKASSLLHNVLKKKPNADIAADALYYIGICYEALRDLGFWSLHESYYEACINAKPHSPQAQRCFSRFNDSITIGYTGSRGTDIPADVQRHLSALKAKAEPKKRR